MAAGKTIVGTDSGKVSSDDTQNPMKPHTVRDNPFTFTELANPFGLIVESVRIREIFDRHFLCGSGTTLAPGRQSYVFADATFFKAC